FRSVVGSGYGVASLAGAQDLESIDLDFAHAGCLGLGRLAGFARALLTAARANLGCFELHGDRLVALSAHAGGSLGGPLPRLELERFGDGGRHGAGRAIAHLKAIFEQQGARGLGHDAERYAGQGRDVGRGSGGLRGWVWRGWVWRGARGRARLRCRRSDALGPRSGGGERALLEHQEGPDADDANGQEPTQRKIGRASCRESGESAVGAGGWKNKQTGDS